MAPALRFLSISLQLFVASARFYLRALAIHFILLPQLVLFFLLVSSSSDAFTFPTPTILYLPRYLNNVLTFLLESLGHVSCIFQYGRHLNKLVLNAQVNECQLSDFV